MPGAECRYIINDDLLDIMTKTEYFSSYKHSRSQYVWAKLHYLAVEYTGHNLLEKIRRSYT